MVVRCLGPRPIILAPVNQFFRSWRHRGSFLHCPVFISRSEGWQVKSPISVHMNPPSPPPPPQAIKEDLGNGPSTSTFHASMRTAVCKDWREHWIPLPVPEGHRQSVHS